ncbi:hypothetical protein CC2G_000364 [Coprinopsis cinerea AmutBmut pab1-1]|nr:hypothetical protein CC2G_000364 [Coprinopsis cinerea AmutBmut pab1-1]
MPAFKHRARNKARKAFSSVTHANTPATGRRSNSKTRAGAQQQRHHGARERSVAVGDEDWVAASEEGVTPAAVNCVSSAEYFDAPSVEVKLADLVQTKKARKKGGLGGDYEFIPHIRSVIVLDETNATGRKTRDMVVDDDENDAWECIDDDMVPGKQKVTYASIAATSPALASH